MSNTTAPNTQLNGRVLWFDGDSTIESYDLMCELVLDGFDPKDFYVVESHKGFEQYNKLVLKTDQLTTKNSIRQLDSGWSLKEEYRDINLADYFRDKIMREFSENSFTDDERYARAVRVKDELDLWKSHKMENLLKTLIYIVDVLEREGVVWGVGRGSSCASYLLYLMGLHLVDSVRYGLNINEFFKDVESHPDKAT